MNKSVNNLILFNLYKTILILKKIYEIKKDYNFKVAIDNALNPM